MILADVILRFANNQLLPLLVDFPYGAKSQSESASIVDVVLGQHHLLELVLRELAFLHACVEELLRVLAQDVLLVQVVVDADVLGSLQRQGVFAHVVIHLLLGHLVRSVVLISQLFLFAVVDEAQLLEHPLLQVSLPMDVKCDLAFDVEIVSLVVAYRVLGEHHDRVVVPEGVGQLVLGQVPGDVDLFALLNLDDEQLPRHLDLLLEGSQIQLAVNGFQSDDHLEFPQPQVLGIAFELEAHVLSLLALLLLEASLSLEARNDLDYVLEQVIAVVPVQDRLDLSAQALVFVVVHLLLLGLSILDHSDLLLARSLLSPRSQAARDDRVADAQIVEFHDFHEETLRLTGEALLKQIVLPLFHLHALAFDVAAPNRLGVTSEHRVSE